MKITFLGTGTSSGIPQIACSCEVCSSTDPKDKRLRCSLLVELDDFKFVIDVGTDFRQQMLRMKLTQLDAVLITHAHFDHIGGLDELRAFNFTQGKEMPVYADELAGSMIQEMFAYAFAEEKYPGAPRLQLNTIENNIIHLGGQEIIPIPIHHGKMPITAFKMGDLTYITDGKYVSDEAKAIIKGSKTLVINAVRIEPHHSHFNLEEALAFIEEMEVEQAYLIHISHRFAKHEDIEKMLPNHVYAAYDGLSLEV